MAWQTSDRYKEVIYGGDYSHRLKIWFNEVELEDADIYCESLKVKRRILPESSSNFSLNNFIAQSIELVLHDIDESIIVSPIRISIGTLVDDEYEYVPIGIFNIEEEPTTDKNKITFRARDNSIKFDFGYNAKPLMDEHEGKATKLQILQDICSQANVECNITSFEGDTDLLGIYDNTIKAREYISNIAEQSGHIATINRLGELIFINLLELENWNIPIEIVESYQYGLHYKIGKIIYESGIIRYITEENEDDALYIDASNQYINEDTINLIKDNLLGFEIDSFKTGKILGNPAIDPYDLITIVDDEKVFTTLATYDLTYKGNMIQTFNTELLKDEVEQNVTKNSENTFKRWAKTNIDSVKAEVTITTGKVETVIQDENNDYLELLAEIQKVNKNIDRIDQIQTSVEQLQTDTYTKTEVQQIVSGTNPDGVIVEAVTTTSGVFDKDGLTIEQSANEGTKTNINSNGMIIYNKNSSSGNDKLLEVNSDGMIAKNIKVSTFLNMGSHSRFEDYVHIDGRYGTGCFWIS